MKKNLLALAFMVTFASTSVLADGEIGHGSKTNPPPPPSARQVDSSDNVLTQVLNAIYAIIAKA